MTKITSLLFDFDGVIVNTEPEYDKLMIGLRLKYGLADDFADQCRGVTNEHIIEKHFSHLPIEEQEKVSQIILDFDKTLPLPWVKGANTFLNRVKREGFNIALVTSSSQPKMDRALRELDLLNSFDTIVTGDDISEGKPHPMCYEKAAQTLGVNASECVVFEDSLYGVQAGKSAKMKVIGITSTFTTNELKRNKVDICFSDFTNSDKIIEYIKKGS